MVDLVSKRWMFFAISAIVIIPGLISLILPGGLKPGIDFTSGSIITFRLDDGSIDQSHVRQAFTDIGHGEAIVQRSDDNTYIVRMTTLASGTRDESGSVQDQSERAQVEGALRDKL